MNNSILLAICLSWVGGFIFGYAYLNIDIRHNIVEGYDCTTITHHETLDSAMEQVHKHQEKTGVLNNEAKGD